MGAVYLMWRLSLYVGLILCLSIVCIGWADTNFPTNILDTNKENDTRDKDKSLTSNKEVL